DQGGRPFRRRRGRAVQPDDLIRELIVTYGVDVAVAVEVTEGEVVTVARARDEVLGPPARRVTEPDRLPWLFVPHGVLAGHHVEPAVAIHVADHHHRAARELEPARDQVRGPIRIVEPDEVVVAADDDVGTAVTVDVADVDAFGDLPEGARVDVMADELKHRRTLRKEGTCLTRNARRRRGQERPLTRAAPA